MRGESNPNDFNRIILLGWFGSHALNLGRVLRYWDLGKLTLFIGCYETKDTLNSFSGSLFLNKWEIKKGMGMGDGRRNWSLN